MNINKNWLKDEEGNLLAPRTLTSCIQDENGNAFQDYADNMVIMSPEETTEVPEDLTSCISNQDMYNIVSDAYDSTKTYAVGDYCIYNNVAYKCNTAITTAEEFNINKWTVIRIGDEVSELNNKLMPQKEWVIGLNKNGRKIYQTEYYAGLSTYNASDTLSPFVIDHNITNIEEVIDCKVSFYDAQGTTYPLPFFDINDGGALHTMLISAKPTSLTFGNRHAWSGYYIHALFTYLKTGE